MCKILSTLLAGLKGAVLSVAYEYANIPPYGKGEGELESLPQAIASTADGEPGAASYLKIRKSQWGR
jgi:hypothetical protein